MRMQPILHALLGCGLGVVLTSSFAFAQPAAKQALPEGLKHVPVDAMAFVHIRAGDFLKSEIGKTLLTELQQDREASKGLKEIEKTLGVTAADLESLTILMLAPAKNSLNQQMRWDMAPQKYNIPRGAMDLPLEKVPPPVKEPEVEKKKEEVKELPVLLQQVIQERDFLPYIQPGPPMPAVSPFPGPLVIVTSTKPLDQKKILRTQLFGPPRQDRYAQGPSLVFLSDRSVLLGATWDLGRYSELIGRKALPKVKPLEAALALGAESHLVVAGGHLSKDVREMLLSPFSPEAEMLAPLTPLMHTDAGLTLDFGKSADMTIQFNAPNEANAAQALQAAKALRVLAELALEKSKDVGESGGAKREMEMALAKALANAVIELKGTTIRAQLKLEVSPSVFKHVTKSIVAAVRTKGDRTQSVNNLKQIALAMHDYHSTYKHFPPPGISSINDPTGKPLLSWRVAILPYIEQAELYKQFDLTQPWDSPANKRLIAKMPAIFVLPGAETKEGATHYRVLVGPGAAFETGQKMKISQFTDGTSNTILAVEAAEPTIWTRPDDLPFDPKGPLPKFGLSPDGFNVAMCDGTVRFIRAGTPAETIRAMITRNGGEPFELPDDGK
jgi:uncharacterized membrane protein